MRIDEEVRQNIPDLPSTQDIARFARSPVALLNQLATFDAEPLVADPEAEPSPAGADFPADPSAPRGGPAAPADPADPGPATAGGEGPDPGAAVDLAALPDDPGLN